MESYFGGKGGSGVYQAIINKIPPHDCYIEPFLGGGSIMMYKRTAGINIGIDLDSDVIDWWNTHRAEIEEGPGREYYDGRHSYLKQCGIDFIEDEIYRFTDYWNSVFVYCDPPYLLTSRSDPRSRYKYELTQADHVRLLKLLTLNDLDYKVAISCYENDLYSHYLGTWNCHRFNGVSRGGPRQELLYMNYPDPVELHDYRFLGKDFIDRGRIKRKITRHVNRLKKLPDLERNAILTALRESFPK